MKFALEALSLVPRGRKIALLGEMLELGESGKAAHREMIESCRSLDGVLTFGEGFEGAEDTPVTSTGVTTRQLLNSI